MPRFGPALVAALLPLALCADDSKDDKKPVAFASKEGRFSVALPARPAEKSNKLKTPAGEVPIHMFLVDLKDRAFVVSYNDYPAVDADAQKVLAGVIEGNAKGVKGKVAASEAFAFGKKEYPGRAATIEFGGEKKQVYRVRAYLAGKRLYQVIALGPDDFARSKPVDEFFRSFAIQE
jgi:hypothetical protein